MAEFYICDKNGQFFMGYKECAKTKRPLFVPSKALAARYKSDVDARHRVCELNTLTEKHRPFQIISDSIKL